MTNETNEKPQCYLVLGAAGSGRREVVADLIEDGLEPTDAPVVFLPAGLDPEGLPAGVTLVTWGWDDGGGIAAAWPAGARIGFFVTDGRANPVDQIEAFKPWMQARQVELARVVCVLHCQLVAANPALMVWYDACVHFADILLLNRREGVENKWFSEFRTRHDKQALPCLVELVKKGRVANPALVLEPQARRMSHWFDEDEPHWAGAWAQVEGVVIEDEAGEEEDADDQPEGDDPYLARLPSGLRAKVLPNIAEYLPTA